MDDLQQCARTKSISRLVTKLGESLQELGVDTKQNREHTASIQAMGSLIHDSMTRPSRHYHTVQHVFDVCQQLSDPITVIAALFHDVVYYHVDKELSETQTRLLRGVFETKNPEGPLTYTPRELLNDPLVTMVEDIFGFQKEKNIDSFSGLNEFLSAVICVRSIHQVLPDSSILARMACCIEATIPFRPRTPISHMQELYNSLSKVNEEYQLGMDDTQLEYAIHSAAAVANQDVANFASDDHLHFLDNTWSLLPESNPALRPGNTFSVQEFHRAVFKMYGFFNMLQPDVVFQSFRGHPTPEEYARMRQRTVRNLDIGRSYVAARLVAVSLVAALAERTGGDAPLSLFLGNRRGSGDLCLDDKLPRFPPEDIAAKCDMEVYKILSEGRRMKVSFDSQQSLLGSYLYSVLGDQAMFELIHNVIVHPMSSEASLRLLQSLPRPAVQQCADALRDVAVCRSDRIQQVMDSLNL